MEYAVKLFSNTYFVLHVEYFKEHDSYAKVKKLNTKNNIYTRELFVRD